MKRVEETALDKFLDFLRKRGTDGGSGEPFSIGKKDKNCIKIPGVHPTTVGVMASQLVALGVLERTSRGQVSMAAPNRLASLTNDQIAEKVRDYSNSRKGIGNRKRKPKEEGPGEPDTVEIDPVLIVEQLDSSEVLYLIGMALEKARSEAPALQSTINELKLMLHQKHTEIDNLREELKKVKTELLDARTEIGKIRSFTTSHDDVRRVVVSLSAPGQSSSRPGGPGFSEKPKVLVDRNKLKSATVERRR